jgi:hypothetical protein
MKRLALSILWNALAWIEDTASALKGKIYSLQVKENLQHVNKRRCKEI